MKRKLTHPPTDSNKRRRVELSATSTDGTQIDHPLLLSLLEPYIDWRTSAAIAVCSSTYRNYSCDMDAISLAMAECDCWTNHGITVYDCCERSHFSCCVKLVSRMDFPLKSASFCPIINLLASNLPANAFKAIAVAFLEVLKQKCDRKLTEHVVCYIARGMAGNTDLTDEQFASRLTTLLHVAGRPVHLASLQNGAPSPLFDILTKRSNVSLLNVMLSDAERDDDALVLFSVCAIQPQHLLYLYSSASPCRFPHIPDVLIGWVIGLDARECKRKSPSKFQVSSALDVLYEMYPGNFSMDTLSFAATRDARTSVKFMIDKGVPVHPCAVVRQLANHKAYDLLKYLLNSRDIRNDKSQCASTPTLTTGRSRMSGYEYTFKFGFGDDNAGLIGNWESIQPYVDTAHIPDSADSSSDLSDDAEDDSSDMSHDSN